MEIHKNGTHYNNNSTTVMSNITSSSNTETLLKEAHVTLAIGFWMTGILCIAGQYFVLDFAIQIPFLKFNFIRELVI